MDIFNEMGSEFTEEQLEAQNEMMENADETAEGTSETGEINENREVNEAGEDSDEVRLGMSAASWEFRAKRELATNGETYYYKKCMENLAAEKIKEKLR